MENKTAMQEYMEWLLKKGWGEGSIQYDKCAELLAKEKEQIGQAYDQGWRDSKQDVHLLYYNSKYSTQK